MAFSFFESITSNNLGSNLLFKMTGAEECYTKKRIKRGTERREGYLCEILKSNHLLIGKAEGQEREKDREKDREKESEKGRESEKNCENKKELTTTS